MMRSLTCLVMLGLLSVAAFARPRYMPKAEMIEKAEVIAIVEITHVEPLLVSTETGLYTQKVDAIVERTYKGSVPRNIILWGVRTTESEISFAPGRYLVFLGRERDKLVGINWHLSARPITKDRVEWYANNKIPFDWKLKRARLSDVLREIESILARQRKDAVPVRRA